MADKKIKMTKEQAIAEHRMMWDWIYKEMQDTGLLKAPTDYIKAFPEKSKNPLCDWVKQNYGELLCDKCPIRWETSKYVTGYPLPMDSCKSYGNSSSPFIEFQLYMLNPYINSSIGKPKAYTKHFVQAEEMANMPAR